MKKIFAFVLASLMVLSLVPASAFAAISVDTPCPTIHTVANCNAVIIDSQEADCANPGWTRFQCTKCGEQFLGNIVAAGGHKWVLDEDHKNTNIPACTEGKDGFGHYECSVCGEEKEEEIPLAELHDLVYVTGVGCEATYTCTVCKGTFNSKGGAVGEHEDWEFTEVITEPTAKTTGLALFTCTAKKCGATKEVVINAQCDCKKDYTSQAAFYNAYAAGKLELVRNSKNPTCTSAGSYAFYACVDCGATVRWTVSDKTKATELPEAVYNADGQVTGIKNGKFEWLKNEKANYEIKKLNHSYVADTDKDHPVQVVDKCNYNKYCKTCKKYIAQDGHTWYNVQETKATCETYGILYKVCQVCGANKNDVTYPLGHDIGTYTYESTCGTYGYTITYCKNDTKCTYAKPASGTNYYDYATGKVYADVTVDHDNKSSTAKVVRPIISIVPLTELKGSHTFTTTQIIGGTQANCASGLVVMQQCKDCNYVTYTQIAPKGHTYGETTTVEATCTSNGSIMKTCEVCGYVDIIILPKLTTHKYVEIGIEYNCSNDLTQLYVGPDGRYYHGIRTMACEFGCAGTEVKSYIDAYNSSSAKVWFESIEEANSYHGAGNLTLVTGSYRAPSCTSAGYGVYLCSKCAKTVYITTPAVGHIPTMNADGPIVIAGKPATCTETGLASYSLCATCNGMITLNEKGEYVSITAAQLVTNPHSATLVEATIYSCDGKPVTYYKCSVEGCGKTFADAAATTPIDVTDTEAHTWKILYSGVVLNCNNDGYPEIRYCATCKTLEKTQYAEFLKDGKVVVDKYTFESWTVEEYAIPTVINYVNGAYNASADKIAKYSHGEATNCPTEWAGKLMNHEAYSNTANCDDEYGYVGHLCSMCGYEYITDFVTAAGGHYNVAGEKLEESCANYIAVKDRTCINCNQVIGNAAELHNVVLGETVAPTCSTEGYTFNYCKNEGCTWVQVINPTPAVEPATYHKNAANLVVGGTLADYATVGNSYTYCPVCLEVIKVQKETKVDEAGLEIYLSADAETYIPGATVKVTVTLDSLKGVDVWGVNFPVTYDPAVFKYVGYAFNTAESAFQTFNVNAVQAYKTFDQWGTVFTKGDLGDVGVVVVAASADDEVEIKGEQTLVTLEFEVVNYTGSEAETEFAVEPSTVVTGLEKGEYVSAYSAYVVDYSKSVTKTYAADVVDGLGKSVNVNYLGSNTAVVTVAGFLDLDGKNGITMADAHALYALIYNNEYDVMADADFDGKITAYDLNVLYSILVGQITVEDYLNPPESVIEASENGTLPQSWWKQN